MRSVFVMWLSCAIACGSASHGASDAPVADTAATDSARDGAVADASRDAPDAASDVVSPTCATSPTILLDTTPSLITNMVEADGILFVATYSGATGSVLAIDPTTGMQVATPLATTGEAGLSVSNGVVYAAEGSSSGTIWQWIPGESPTALVTARNSPGAVTTDGTYVYWRENTATSGAGVVQRRALAGTAVTKVMDCNLPFELFVVGGVMYCPSYTAGNVLYAAADGTSTGVNGFGYAMGSVGGGYPIASTILDGGNLYFVNLYNNPELYRGPLPAGPSVLLTKSPEISRYAGLAATPDYFYAVDSDRGIDRIQRSDDSVATIYSTVGLAQDPVIWNGQLYVLGQNPEVSGVRYVLHCID